MQKLQINYAYNRKQITYLGFSEQFFFTSAHNLIYFLRILGKVSAVIFSLDLAAKENVHIPKKKNRGEPNVQQVMNIKYNHEQLCFCSTLNSVCACTLLGVGEKIVRGEVTAQNDCLKSLELKKGSFWLCNWIIITSIIYVTGTLFLKLNEVY